MLDNEPSSAAFELVRYMKCDVTCTAWWYNALKHEKYLIVGTCAHEILVLYWKDNDKQILTENSSDMQTKGSIVRNLKGHIAPVLQIDVIKRTDTLLSCASDRTIYLWDLHSGTIVKQFNDINSTFDVFTACALQFKPSRKCHVETVKEEEGWIAAAGDESFVNIYSTKTGKLSYSIPCENNLIQYMICLTNCIALPLLNEQQQEEEGVETSTCVLVTSDARGIIEVFKVAYHHRPNSSAIKELQNQNFENLKITWGKVYTIAMPQPCVILQSIEGNSYQQEGLLDAEDDSVLTMARQRYLYAGGIYGEIFVIDLKDGTVCCTIEPDTDINAAGKVALL